MLTINLETKTLKDKNKTLIDNGIPVNGYIISSEPITFERLEELYHIYKHSVPNTIKYKKQYFKALDSNQLDTKDLITGANRQIAKENLELAILIGVLNGSLIWPNENQWFWQSEKDKDFVLLKKWIVI